MSEPSTRMKLLGILSMVYIVFFVAIFLGFGVSEIAHTPTQATAIPQVAGARTQVAASSVTISTVEQDIMQQVNSVRSKNSVPVATLDSALQNTTQTRALDMVSRQYFSHTSTDGTTYVDLLPAKRSFSCENLNLAFTTDPETVVADWLASDKGHRECLLDTRVKRAGVSVRKFADHVQPESASATKNSTTTYVVVLLLASE